MVVYVGPSGLIEHADLAILPRTLSWSCVCIYIYIYIYIYFFYVYFYISIYIYILYIQFRLYNIGIYLFRTTKVQQQSLNNLGNEGLRFQI